MPRKLLLVLVGMLLILGAIALVSVFSADPADGYDAESGYGTMDRVDPGP